MTRAVKGSVLVLGGFLLGATVFREQVAQAAANLGVTVMNTRETAVPVSQVPVVDGGNAASLSEGNHEIFGGPYTATALSIRMSAGTRWVVLSKQGGNIGAFFYGPLNNGNESIVLALPRPVEFDSINCHGDVVTEVRCSVSWVGATP